MKRFFYLMVLAVSLYVTGCDKNPDATDSKYPSIVFWENQYNDGNNLWYVCYGTSSKELSFVCFEEGSIDPPMIPGTRRVVSRTISRKEGTKTFIDRQEGWLIVDNPMTEMIQLPTDHQLHEIHKGRHTSSDKTVTLRQLQAYLESQPTEYSIDNLLSYIDAKTSND